MATTLLSYDDVLKRTNENKRFLLLGNGFSMSCNYERFFYQNYSVLAGTVFGEAYKLYDFRA